MRKVYRGTRSEAERLCDTCHSSLVLKGAADSQEYIHCSIMNGPVPFRVVSCSDYGKRTDVPLYMMKEIAWTVRTDKKRQFVGFQPPENNNLE